MCCIYLQVPELGFPRGGGCCNTMVVPTKVVTEVGKI